MRMGAHVAAHLNIASGGEPSEAETPRATGVSGHDAEALQRLPQPPHQDQRHL
jgi:hypothetical protein